MNLNSAPKPKTQSSATCTVLVNIAVGIPPTYILIRSIFDALSIGGSSVAAVLLCMKWGEVLFDYKINTQQ